MLCLITLGPEHMYRKIMLFNGNVLFVCFPLERVSIPEFDIKEVYLLPRYQPDVFIRDYYLTLMDDT
jgi:hypothetical protein